ncbi:response regulator, partial [Thermodesulfobacteriota bacterium]
MSKILVVDDEAPNRELLKDFLEAKDYTVITAENGKEAVEKIGEKPALVLLDIQMPVMDGFQALKKIKEVDTSIGVVMVTGLAREDVAMACIEAGAHDYITKPIDMNHLINVIEILMIQRTEETPADDIESLIEDTPPETVEEPAEEKKEMPDVPDKPKDTAKRMCRRFQIPGASGKIKKTGLFDTFKGFSKEYPVMDLSKGGLAFSCTESFKKNQKITFQLLVPGESPLNLLSIIRKVGRPDRNGNRFCGIQYFP